MIDCEVTHIAPDGTRHTVTCEAATTRKAAICYMRLTDSTTLGLPKPKFGSKFDVKVGGRVYRVSWAQALTEPSSKKRALRKKLTDPAERRSGAGGEVVAGW